MLRALKTKLAKFLQAQTEIATAPQFAAIRGDLRVLQERQSDGLLEALQQLHVIKERLEIRAESGSKTNDESQTAQDARILERERRDVTEIQRMVGIACARIENFIKVQKEHRAVIEQSIAALAPDRVHGVRST